MRNRLPLWFRQPLPDRDVFGLLVLLKELNVNTVCQSSHCPNLSGCFKNKKLTLMLLGNICTRNCRFCAVDKEKSLPLSLDIYEPERIKEAVVRLDLDFVVLTSVARDDLEDGGSSQFRNAIDAIRRIPRTIKIEVLIPDFRGCLNALKAVVLAKPDIIGHNLETVPRIYSEVRPQADYNRALNILKNIKESDKEIITKSALLLGLGEEEGEVIQTIKDLVLVKTDILTLGQYLAPSPEHYRVKEFIRIEKFDHYKEMALSLGIKAVLSGPLVRSSYKAEELYEEVSGCMI